MKQELIEKIKGGKRWTKGKYDRLYFNDYVLGLKAEHYKTGNICYAEIEEWPFLEGADMEAVNEEVGEISHSYARKIADGKHYIDLDTGEVVSSGFFKARIEYLVLKATKELEAEGKSAEGEDPALSEQTLTQSSTKKSTRKMSETEAVEALTEATTADAVQKIIKGTKRAALLKLARAVEGITGTHVKSNTGRSTLERVLLQNAEKLVGIDWQTAIETLERVRRMRKWQDETVRRLANADNLHNFTKRQLTVLVKAWSIDIKKSATKAEMLLALMVSEKAVA